MWLPRYRLLYTATPVPSGHIYVERGELAPYLEKLRSPRRWWLRYASRVRAGAQVAYWPPHPEFNDLRSPAIWWRVYARIQRSRVVMNTPPGNEMWFTPDGCIVIGKIAAMLRDGPTYDRAQAIFESLMALEHQRPTVTEERGPYMVERPGKTMGSA